MKPGRASPLVGHFEEGDEFIFEFVSQSQPIFTLLLLQYALDEHGQQLLLLKDGVAVARYEAVK